MPSAVFPRPSFLTCESVTAFGVPGPYMTVTRSGKIQTRGTTMRGRVWRETYNPMFIGNVDVEGWLAWVRWAYNTGTVFTIKHLTTPGSGLAPNGVGDLTVQVKGASQTGATLVTDGWPLSTSNVVRAGDVIRVVGVGAVLQITEDANSDGAGEATLAINPPIFTGGSPLDNATVTTTDVTVNVVIAQEPNWPPVGNAFWYQGFELTFRESP